MAGVSRLARAAFNAFKAAKGNKGKQVANLTGFSIRAFDEVNPRKVARLVRQGAAEHTNTVKNRAIGFTSAVAVAATGYGVYQSNKVDGLQTQLSEEQQNNALLQQEVNQSKQEAQEAREETAAVKQELNDLRQAQQNQEQPENNQGKYKVKQGDSFWKIAKELLMEKHKDEQGYIPSNKAILDLATEIMDKNDYNLADDNWHSAPMLLPDAELDLTEINVP